MMYPCLICTLRKAYVKLNLIYMICEHMETQVHAVMGEASTSKGKDQMEETERMQSVAMSRTSGQKICSCNQLSAYFHAVYKISFENL